MAPLLADIAHVEVPGTPEVDALDPQFRPERVADVLLQVVERLLPGPLLLIAEESHWADMASVHLLERIAAATPGRPWAVVAVRRGDAGGFTPTAGIVVRLDPLPRDIVERLVIEATEAAPLRPHEVTAVVDRAEGNPLFVEEVTRIARATGSLQEMPESLQAAMGAQIDLLDPVARRILRYASVLGRSFRREVLRETLAGDGLTADPATLSELSEYLEADGPGRLRFRNSLLRDAAYEELAYRTRSRLHRAAGLAMERMSTDVEVDAPTLSLHFARAGDSERTWRYGLVAGAAARRSFAVADAAAQYELALDAARHLDVAGARAGRRVVGARRTARTVGSAERVHRRLSSGRHPVGGGPGRPGGAADAAGPRARTRRRLCHGAALGGASASSSRVGRRRRGVAALGCDSTTSRHSSGSARSDRGRPVAGPSRRLEGARDTDDPETLVQALMAIDHAELYLGMRVEGAHTKEALAICMANGYRPRESIARTNLGNFAYFAGRWDEAIDWFESSARVALEAGNAFGAAETALSLGEILVSRGETRRGGASPARCRSRAARLGHGLRICLR